jgi:tetratricopeptide (TPR) repeat protein
MKVFLILVSLFTLLFSSAVSCNDNSGSIKNKTNNRELANSYLDSANIRLERNDLYKALEYYDKSIELNPNNSRAFFQRADTKLKLGNISIKSVIDDLNKCIELNPNYSEAFYFRGYQYFLSREFNSVIRDMENFKKLDPYNQLGQRENADIYIALSLDSLEEYDKAIVSYTNLIHDFPDNAHTYYNRRGLLKVVKEQKDYNGALEDFTISIKIKPDADVYYNRGFLFLTLRMKEQSCQDFKKSAELGGNSAYEYIMTFCN